MDFLNWGGEHPWLFILLLMTASSVAHGIGRLGSTVVKNVAPKK